MSAAAFAFSDRNSPRSGALAFAYGMSCLAGALAMLGYLVPWLGRGVSFHTIVVVPALTGVIGGIAALPLALPLMAAAERWSWRNPLIYLTVTPVLFVAAQMIALGLFVGAAWSGFAIPINPDHAFHVDAQMGYLSALITAVATYWVVRGRLSGGR